MEHEYGPDQMKKFLKYELDNYLTGRAFERKKELPLVAGREPAVHPLPQGLAGDVRAARLHRRGRAERARWRSSWPTRSSSSRRTRRRASCWDTCARRRPTRSSTCSTTCSSTSRCTTTARPRPATRARRTASTASRSSVEAKKFRADDQGNENEVPMNDQIDVGVFAAAETRQERRGQAALLRQAPHRLGRSADRGGRGRGAGARRDRPVPQADRSGHPRQHRRRHASRQFKQLRSAVHSVSPRERQSAPAAAKMFIASRNVDFDVGSRGRAVDRLDDVGNDAVDSWPAGRPQSNDANRSRRQVLLILQVQIGRHEHLEARLLGGIEQLAVLFRGPSALVGGDDIVMPQPLAQGNRRALVEQQAHGFRQAPGRSARRVRGRLEPVQWSHRETTPRTASRSLRLRGFRIASPPLRGSPETPTLHSGAQDSAQLQGMMTNRS